MAGDREATSAELRRPHLLGELAVVAVLLFAYDHIRALSTARAAEAMSAGHRLLADESALHVDVEQWANTLLAQHVSWELFASWYYQLAHTTVTMSVLCYLWVCCPAGYRRARNALIATNAVALLVFWLFPVAPPRLLTGAGFIDAGLVTGAQAATTVSPNQFAAMPSLHVAWAIWVAVQVTRNVPSRFAHATAVAYAVTTSVVVVATGNHYVLDVAAGGLLVLAVEAAVLFASSRVDSDFDLAAA